MTARANVANLREWAANRHAVKDQRYGDEPYVVHLDEVAGVAEEFFPGDVQLQEGAYGHDLLEDTDATPEEMVSAGWSASAVKDVESVTNEDTDEETLAKTKARGVSGIKLKLCDRLANARRRGKIRKYRAKMPLFEATLFDPNHTELLPIWNALREELAKDAA
jgi:(p)ppGpp synthase/HD superfamily hydrolase